MPSNSNSQSRAKALWRLSRSLRSETRRSQWLLPGSSSSAPLLAGVSPSGAAPGPAAIPAASPLLQEHPESRGRRTCALAPQHAATGPPARAHSQAGRCSHPSWGARGGNGKQPLRFQVEKDSGPFPCPWPLCSGLGGPPGPPQPRPPHPPAAANPKFWVAQAWGGGGRPVQDALSVPGVTHSLSLRAAERSGRENKSN